MFSRVLLRKDPIFNYFRFVLLFILLSDILLSVLYKFLSNMCQMPYILLSSISLFYICLSNYMSSFKIQWFTKHFIIFPLKLNFISPQFTILYFSLGLDLFLNYGDVGRGLQNHANLCLLQNQFGRKCQAREAMQFKILHRDNL